MKRAGRKHSSKTAFFKATHFSKSGNDSFDDIKSHFDIFIALATFVSRKFGQLQVSQKVRGNTDQYLVYITEVGTNNITVYTHN